MRFGIAGKKKAKLCNVKIQSFKLGQKTTVPAVALRFMVPMSNDVLSQFDPLLRAFLYEKNGQGAKEQKQLEGIPVVSDLPQLRPAGEKLGELNWKDEQTGSKLHIYQGVTGDGDIKLKDGKVHAFKLVPKDGGTTQVFFTFFATDIDAETLGALAVLHQHEVEIELEAPEVVDKQTNLDDSKGEVTGTPGKVARLPRTATTPEDALAAANAVH